MSKRKDNTSIPGGFPLIRPVGLSGLLVSFANTLSDPANRAAIAFRAAIDAEKLPGIIETSTALTSTFISYDPQKTPLETLHSHLTDMAKSRDWGQADLPANRKLWRIPAVFDGPQLNEAAALAGITSAEAIAELSTQRVRVMTIGFAPGLPYLGTLPAHWDIPRQQQLTRQVPAGALAVAVRQLVLFTNPTPTGWRWVGHTAFRNFRPEAAEPFALKTGDEVQFTPITETELQQLTTSDETGFGGAKWETLP